MRWVPKPREEDSAPAAVKGVRNRDRGRDPSAQCYFSRLPVSADFVQENAPVWTRFSMNATHLPDLPLFFRPLPDTVIQLDSRPVPFGWLYGRTH